MHSPSGVDARRRDVAHVGKAPPLPEMTISGLTRGQVFGEDRIAQITIFPGSAGRAARPSGGLFRFRLDVSSESQITLRHRAFRTVALAPSSMSARYAEAKGSHDRPARVGAGGRSGQSHAVKECDRPFRRTASGRKAGDEVTTFVHSCSGVSLEQRSVRPPTRLHAHTSKPVWK